MRKITAIAALCSFLLCLWAGYHGAAWRDAQDKQVQAVHPVMQTDQVIDANTTIVYQFFYTRDRVTKEQIEPAPVFLQGVDPEQLQSIYNGWQILLFSPEKVILRCRIDGLSSEAYLLGESDGCLAVFYEDAGKALHLKEKTELPLSALPDGEARQIREGMRVTGEENLAKVLSDLMS